MLLHTSGVNPKQGSALIPISLDISHFSEKWAPKLSCKTPSEVSKQASKIITHYMFFAVSVLVLGHIYGVDFYVCMLYDYFDYT